MQQTPRFSIGDYVRIMQTDDMVHIGLANKHGFIRDILQQNESPYEVAEIELIGGKRRRVSTSSLMHNTRERQ